jgi:hypothetical protein
MIELTVHEVAPQMSRYQSNKLPLGWIANPFILQIIVQLMCHIGKSHDSKHTIDKKSGNY